MKRLIAVLMILASLFSVASADYAYSKGNALVYNEYAKSFFNLPQLDVDASYNIKDGYTGGKITLWPDGNCYIGFIDDNSEENIGAVCFDAVNNDAEFLVRCACLIWTVELFDKKHYQILFDAYIQLRKNPDQDYKTRLLYDNTLILGYSSSGLAAYILSD